MYNEAKNNKEELKPFFLEDTTDDILVNNKLENYIERGWCYGGIIEIGIISNYYNLNISVYWTDNNDPLNLLLSYFSLMTDAIVYVCFSYSICSAVSSIKKVSFNLLYIALVGHKVSKHLKGITFLAYLFLHVYL